jgi:hypothetical protein
MKKTLLRALRYFIYFWPRLPDLVDQRTFYTLYIVVTTFVSTKKCKRNERERDRMKKGVDIGGLGCDSPRRGDPNRIADSGKGRPFPPSPIPRFAQWG